MSDNYNRVVHLELLVILDAFNDQVKGFNEVGYDHFLAKVESLNIEFSIDLELRYTPSTPGVMYLPNGDPGHPGELAEVKIIFTYHEFLVMNNNLFKKLVPHCNDYQMIMLKTALIEGVDNIINGNAEFYDSQINYCHESEVE